MGQRPEVDCEEVVHRERTIGNPIADGIGDGRHPIAPAASPIVANGTGTIVLSILITHLFALIHASHSLCGMFWSD